MAVSAYYMMGMESGNLRWWESIFTDGTFDTVEANSSSPISGTFDLHTRSNDGDGKVIAQTTIAFVDGGGGADTITDSDVGGSFGVFHVGQDIVVTGSASNNGTYTIVAVWSRVITLDTGVLTTEAEGASVTITGKWGTGAYATVNCGSTGQWREHSANNVNTVLMPDGGGFDLNFKFKVVATPAGLNLMEIFRIGTTVPSQGPFKIFCSGASDGSITIAAQGTGGGVVDVTEITSGTIYDIRVKGWMPDGAGQRYPGWFNCWVYTADTQTVVGRASVEADPTTSDGIGNMTHFTMGCRPVINNASFLDGAQDYYFSDFVVNSFTAWDDDSDPGSGEISGHAMTGDGSVVDWTASGGANWDNVDTEDAGTFNYTVLGATTEKDHYDFLDYTGAGIEKWVSVLVAHSDHDGSGNADVFHRQGFWKDVSNIDEIGMLVSGDFHNYQGYILDAKIGGGALDSVYVDALQIYLNKFSNLVGINDKEVWYAFVEIYNDTGRTPFTGAEDQPILMIQTESQAV